MNAVEVSALLRRAATAIKDDRQSITTGAADDDLFMHAVACVLENHAARIDYAKPDSVAPDRLYADVLRIARAYLGGAA
jgi:hypothetical protein